MYMYIIFIILLSYEKVVYAHTIIGSSASDCVLIILLELYTLAGLFEGNFIWVDQCDS